MADGFSGAAVFVYNVPATYQASVDGDTFAATFMEEATAFNTTTVAVAQDSLKLTLLPNGFQPIVPGSVRFRYNGDLFVDRAGAVYRNPSAIDDSAELAGSMDYSTSIVTLDVYTGGDGAVELDSLLTRSHQNSGSYVMFRTNGSPIGPASLIIAGSFVDGTPFDVSADSSGNLVATNVQGDVDVNTGLVEVKFGATVDSVFTPKPVLFDSLTYNAVQTTFLPLDPAVLGLDPTRLPEDGRVPIFRPAEVVVIHHTKTETMPSPLTAAQMVTLSRHPISKLDVLDENGLVVDPALYTADLDAGEVTMATPLDLSAYQQPLVARTRIEDMRLVTDVQIQGQLTISSGVAFDFPADETKVSSALIAGDLGARVANLFTQQTWTNVFSDSRIGNDSVGKFNDVDFPLGIVDDDAITERWAIIFTSQNSFEVLGERVGVIATGDTAHDCSPINPNTGRPYFTMPFGGWGGGWVNNNVVRFNTVGALYGLWLARTVESGPSTNDTDMGRIEGRGDAD